MKQMSVYRAVSLLPWKLEERSCTLLASDAADRSIDSV